MSAVGQGRIAENQASVAKELFTLDEVAVLLSLSKRKVEQLVAKGLLRSAIAPGTERSRRISRTMIHEYVEGFDSQNPPSLRFKKRRT